MGWRWRETTVVLVVVVVEHVSSGHGRKKRVRGTEGEQRKEKRK